MDRSKTSNSPSQKRCGKAEKTELSTACRDQPLPIVLNFRNNDTLEEELLFYVYPRYVWAPVHVVAAEAPMLYDDFNKFKDDLKKLVELLGGKSIEEKDLDILIEEHSQYYDADVRQKAKTLVLHRLKDPHIKDIEEVIEHNVILQKALILQEIYFRKALRKRQQSVHVFNWAGQLSLPFVHIVLKNCYSKKAKAMLDQIENEYLPCSCYCKGPCTTCKSIYSIMTPEHFLCTVREINGKKALLPTGGYFSQRDGYFAVSCSRKFCENRTCLQRIPSCPQTISLGVVYTAKRGYALVALEDAAAGTIIVEHKGLVYHYEESQKCRLYSYPLAEDYLSWDGEEYGTLQRFCNNSCDPSMMMISVLEGGYQGKGKIYRIILVAKRDVKAGEELTFEYHPSVPLTAKKPSTGEFIKCMCGAKKCRGWF